MKFNFIRIVLLWVLLIPGIASTAQEIIRNYGDNCTGSPQAFSVSCNGTCTNFTWSISGSHTSPGGGTNGQGIGGFSWSSAGGQSVSVSFDQNGTPLTRSYAVTINSTLEPEVTISSAPSGSVVYGTQITFSQSSTNGGTAPTYQWFVNEQSQSGEVGAQFITNGLQNNDRVMVRMTPNTVCPTKSYDESNIITQSVTYTITPPTVNNVSIDYGTGTTLTAGGAGTNETYRWYTAASGGSFVQGTTYNTPVLYDNTTYYVSKRNTVTSAESARVVQIVTVNILPPVITAMSLETCGPKVLTRGNPPANVVWYWQGTDPNGTLTSNSASTYTVEQATDQYYYLRAKSLSSNVWSAAVGVKVTTDPVDLVLSAYDLPEVQATHSITLATGFSVPPSKTFTAKIGVSSICNDVYNWSEQTTYDQTGLAVARSKNFTDGSGSALQNQSIDLVSKKVWVTQPVYDNDNQPTLSTLTAPLLESDFIYKKNFVSTAAGQAYGPNDFDKSIQSNSQGEIYNPKSVGTGPGTLGWYYSANNTLEPATPTTGFPYERSYSEPGPDPIKSTTAEPGDSYRMGTGHELSVERYPFSKSELTHYFNLREYFVATPLSVSLEGSNLISNSDAASLTGFSASQDVTLATTTINQETYIKATTNQHTGMPGVFPIGGSITVSAGSKYTFKMQGYRTGVGVVSIYVKDVTNQSNIVWPGKSVPTSVNEGWIENTFVIPTGCTSIQVGIAWGATPFQDADAFYINKVSLAEVTNADTMPYGYKLVTTDSDGKKTVTFSDADGTSLASAIVLSTNSTTSPPTYTYSQWSYTYYNDLGQIKASVAPKGVTASTAQPAFTSYKKYDHLGRVIEVMSADEGMSQYVYNLDGAVRFSQNQVQREATPQRFSYTNYDYLGRFIESGEYSCSGSNPFIFEPQTVASPAPRSVLSIVESVDFNGVSWNEPSEKQRCTDYSLVKYDVFEAGSGGTQTNLIGQISYTENAISKTWYSYDEFGGLAWTKQNIVGLGDKTIEYTSDYFGDVTEVAYQKGSATDRFHHHYTYDATQRLSEAYTSKDGQTKTLHAKYYYYLHGPLKRVELATNIQGIDYVYNIDGSLKMINNSDAAMDPGLDGFSGTHAGFMKDVFGEVLDYNVNDYSSAGVNDGAVTLSGFQDQFGGNVKDIRWHSPTDNHVQRAYAYSYDNVNQLDNSKFGNVTGSNGNYAIAFPDLAYNEDIGSYDKNGNIQSLVRKNKNATNIGNYAYNYQANTNKLNSVTDNGASFLNYTYNAIGQMVQQVEGDKTMKIAYDPYGFVKEIRDQSDALLESFGYDERGNRIIRTVYTNGAASNRTFYVHDTGGNVLAIYQQALPGTIISLTEMPVYGSGRVAVYKPVVSTFFYEVSDHLGNVRGVIGNPETLNYIATIEDNGVVAVTNPRVQEMASFKNLDATDVTDAYMNHTAPSQYMANPSYSSYPYWTAGMSGSQAADKSVGPAIGLKVEPGDKLDFETWVKYEKKGSYSRPGIGAAMVSILAGNFVGTAPGLDVITKATQVFQNGVASALAGNAGDVAGLPYAYMYYLLYDNNFTPVTAGWARVSTAGGFDIGQGNLATHGKLTIPTITIAQPGYLYAFVVNESEQTRVWFDDFKVSHQRSTVVAGADYYPFGLVISERNIGREEYRYGYQGAFSEEDSVTGWNDFELRMYDARIGRWISPDPYAQFASPYLAMGNTPHMSVDSNGGICCDDVPLFSEADLVEGATSIQLAPPTYPTLLGGPISLHGASSASAMAPSPWYDGFTGVAGSGSGLSTDAAVTGLASAEDLIPEPVMLPQMPLTAPSTAPLMSSLSFPSASTIQTIAGYLSVIPVLNTPLGLVETGAALIAGDYWGAGFALAGALPVAGILIKGAVKATALTIGAVRKLNAARRVGMQAHDNFYRIMKARNWATNTRQTYSHGGINKILGPDAISPNGNFFLELKPATKWGKAKGIVQKKLYEKFTGMHGRVIYYDATTGNLLPYYK